MSEKIIIDDKLINFLLDFLPKKKKIPEKIENKNYENNFNDLHSKLIGKTIYKSVVNDLKKELMIKFYSTRIQAGEPVGIISAQTLGERLTQTKLNVFHMSGVTQKLATTGINKINELLNATKELSIINHKIILNDNYDIEKIKSINFVEISLKNFNYIGQIKQKQFQKPVEKYFNLKILDFSHWIEMNIDPIVLYYNNIYIEDLAKKIEETTNYKVLYSPQHLGFLWIHTSDKKKLLSILKKVLFFGILGIEKIFFTRENNNWVLETTCLNVGKKSQNIFYKILSSKLVNPYKTISSNLWDIYNVFGIEATKNFLIEQFAEITEGVKICHIELLVDQMTHKGTICPISRYALRNENIGPLTKISFEEILSNIVRSSIKKEVDTIESNNARIIAGQMTKVGTGVVSLIHE